MARQIRGDKVFSYSQTGRGELDELLSFPARPLGPWQEKGVLAIPRVFFLSFLFLLVLFSQARIEVQSTSSLVDRPT